MNWPAALDNHKALILLYLLDTSVLITAHNLYYPVNRVPEFWGWLRHVGSLGAVKIPAECFEEVKDGRKDGAKDLLYAWLKQADTKVALLLDEDVDPMVVAKVISDGYANDLTEDEIELVGRDPFVIAYALMDAANRCVVTTEVSKPARTRHNRHVPDVCKTLGVNCCDTFAFTRQLDFSTDWED